MDHLLLRQTSQDALMSVLIDDLAREASRKETALDSLQESQKGARFGGWLSKISALFRIPLATDNVEEALRYPRLERRIQKSTNLLTPKQKASLVRASLRRSLARVDQSVLTQRTETPFGRHCD